MAVASIALNASPKNQLSRFQRGPGGAPGSGGGSMIARTGAHLAAEDPIDPSAVSEDGRQQDPRSAQEQGQGVVGIGGLPEGHVVRNHVGEKARRQPKVAG